MRMGMNPSRALPFLLPLLALLSAAPATTPPTMADKTTALREEWKDRLHEEGLNALAAPPFVIAGNGTPAQLARYRDSTVLAAMHSLEATYFDKSPTEPIVIFLFESEGPYKRLALKWFDDKNVPHYGFYRHRERVMFMNVGTGTG
ncbi:MAG: glycogen branching enzyme, partial [Phycisphaerales bacterium]|nr:glycogen branching enzyme [Phycisphaerales bacterium]